MPTQPPGSPGNLLLARLSPGDRALLDPHLRAVPLALRDVLVHPNRVIEHVYFLEAGLASVISEAADGTRLEVGVFGRDGVSAPSLLLGVDRTPQMTFMQVAGSALRIKVGALTTVLGESPSLHAYLLRYVQTFVVQVAHTAVSNGTSTIDERLARWLLMCHDRLDGETVPLTHEFLALMLGVRRAGVTLAVQKLEAAGLVRGRRGLITILERGGLQALAGGSYGPAEAEYERLIGPLRCR